MTEQPTNRRVRDFYRENPFPYYDLSDFPTFDHLKQRASGYVRRLDQSIGSHATVLEAGCGTGQLCNYLAHNPGRRIIGVDVVQASLELGSGLRNQLGFRNLEFLQANLFNLPFREERFDVVLCHGVLHHLHDPQGGFRKLSGLLRQGGGIAVGLYHRLGRRRHWRRAREVRDLGVVDIELPGCYRPPGENENPRTRSSWFLDAFHHPHESGHLLLETAGWFRKNGITVTASVPSFRWGAGFWGTHPFFEPFEISRWHRNAFTFLCRDLRWWVKPTENGYFILFGRKE